MTCAEFNKQLDAWLAGTLPEAEARAVEQHAADCASCGARLEAASAIAIPSSQLAPPAALREKTLRAVARRRALGQWRRVAAGVAAVAAVSLLLLRDQPAPPAPPAAPEAGSQMLALARARPQLAALDAAEQEVASALREQPADAALTGALRRIQRQREALQRMVTEAPL